ncbi:MAG TPA: VWA domain-containing protein [Terriglobales bacterium]|nr:VWA domain-containing protein [Terriglobales bacterium]
MRTSAAVAALLLAAIAAPALAQVPKKKAEDIRVDVTVTAVTIAVTVQDKAEHRYINDLTQKDFTVYENNERRTITHFNHDFDAPLSLAVLLDVSGSMAVQDKLEEAKVGLRNMVTDVLAPRDEVSLLIFADGQVEVAAPFSADRTVFLRELDKVQAYGQTALNDAVAVSPEFADRGRNEKRALLLVTDGVENDSQLSPDQALEIARTVDVPIYTIGYKIPLSDQLLKSLKRGKAVTSTGIVETLTKFSRATGGKAFFVDRPGDMYAILRGLKQEQSHQYIIGYTSYKDETGQYRRIRVETSNKRYKVRTREGY